MIVHISHPTLAQCRQAARRVGAAPHGRRALDSVRPRGVAGVFRDRAPLSLLLYTAGLERRLVWQDSTGFALLEPPLARPEIWRRSRVDRLGVLRWLDRHWSTLMFAVPVLVLFLVAVGLVLGPGLRLAAVVVVLIAMLYVCVVVTALPIWQIVSSRRTTAQKQAASALTADQWTMPLFHQEQAHRIDELLGRVQNRLLELIEDEVQQAARDRGGEVGPVRLSAELAYPHAGVTTDAAAQRVAARFPVTCADVSMRSFDRRSEDPGRRPFRPVAFFWFYLGAIAVVIASIASFVADAERDACAPDTCAAAPTSYEWAVVWAVYRLLGLNVPGVVPVSGYTLTLGWFITVLGATAVLVGFVAASAQIRATKQEKKDLMIRLDGSRTRVLLVTVADEERDAVLDAIENHIGRRVEPRFDGLVPVFDVGEINDTEIYVVQAAQGTTGAGGAIVTTGEAIRQLAPHYALIVGMCYGLRPDRQRIGDILVSEKIKDLDHGKLVEPPGGGEGPVAEVLRGEVVNPAPMLVTAIRAASRGWLQTRRDVPVEVGLMLAWNKLVNSKQTVERLRAEHPDAIGADMEGAGFYAAARAARVESVLVKAICDWGYDRDPTTLEAAKREATRNSAEFVLHLILAGIFARTPAQRIGN